MATISKIKTPDGTTHNIIDTNTKVTSAANHYTPAADTSAALSVDASSSTAATWNSTSLVTGVNLQRDAKGHVTGVTVDSVKMPANPNTNTTYTIASGDSNGQIKVTPSPGSAYNVSVKGLGSAAYTNSSAYMAAKPTCIELGGSADDAVNEGFIDFHFNNSSADYTSRIIESASGTLAINGVTITSGKVVTATTFTGALSGNATTATTATKLGSSDIGSATQPIYLSGGTATACTYTLGKSVPSDAVFTDTNTKVTQAYSTTNNAYPLLMCATAGVSSTSSRGAKTAILNNQIYANPSTGNITANKFVGNVEAGTVDSDDILTSYITIANPDATSSTPGLWFGYNACSRIDMTMADAAETQLEVMRLNNGTTAPILIIGDGLYTNDIGQTNVVAGAQVNLKTSTTCAVAVVESSSSFIPAGNGVMYLGTSANKWKQIYASSATVQTSDEREKNNIMAIADYPTMFSDGNVFEILFSKLTPKTYYLNMEDDKPELHIGFVAQDVAKALEELGMGEDDLGLLQHDYWTDEETGEEKDAYGLRYEEFIALNTYVLQKLISEKDDMKSRLEKIEETLGIYA